MCLLWRIGFIATDPGNDHPVEPCPRASMIMIGQLKCLLLTCFFLNPTLIIRTESHLM